MELRGGEALGRFARERHVHYEVEPEEVVEGERREPVGYQVRLFATHSDEKLGLPSCERCVELLRDLRAFAEGVIAEGDVARRTEIVPASPALYQSPEDSDADEVALTLRLRCSSPEHREEKGEDRCLGELRQRLDAAGAARR
jgi:hypothetical protein